MAESNIMQFITEQSPLQRVSIFHPNIAC